VSGPRCSAETNAFRYGAAESGSCRESLVLSLADHIELRAECDLLVAVSACPQERNPCNGFTPSAIGLSTWRP
jgi:uncharacterized protein YcgI (DUF1989 family)